jgi:hypothetical protein
VNDALRNSFMVEVLDLFEQNMIFEKRRASRTSLERVLIVTDNSSCLRSKGRMTATVDLVKFSTVTGQFFV